MNQCDHQTFMGQPAGHVPVSWRCMDCGMTLTAGEMHLRGIILEVKIQVEKIAATLAERGRAG